MITGGGTAYSSARQVLWAGLWATVGGLWVIAWFVPWTSRGLLSTSSLADAVGLLRGGSLPSLVPGWAVGLLLVGPMCGLLLVASAAHDGSVVAMTRGAVVAVMALVLAVCFHAVALQDPGRLGPGGWLTTAGVALGLAGAVARLRHRRTRSAREAIDE